MCTCFLREYAGCGVLLAAVTHVYLQPLSSIRFIFQRSHGLEYPCCYDRVKIMLEGIETSPNVWTFPRWTPDSLECRMDYEGDRPGSWRWLSTGAHSRSVAGGFCLGGPGRKGENGTRHLDWCLKFGALRNSRTRSVRGRWDGFRFMELFSGAHLGDFATSVRSLAVCLPSGYTMLT